MSVDVIGDFLTILRNGLLVYKKSVFAPYSKMRHDITRVLKDEGYIREFSIHEDNGKKTIEVFFRYYAGESAIHEIARVSKPSQREYVSCKNIDSVIGGLGISILTTSKGIMTDKSARKVGVGGEILCSVW